MRARLFGVLRGILWGCGVSIVVLLVLMGIEFGLSLILQLDLKTYSWLIAVAVGAHFACRQARTTAWANCILFAVLAEIFVVTAIPEANETLTQLYPNAAGQWHYPTMLVLTIPAALVGGVLWTRNNKCSSTRG